MSLKTCLLNWCPCICCCLQDPPRPPPTNTRLQHVRPATPGPNGRAASSAAATKTALQALSGSPESADGAASPASLHTTHPSGTFLATAAGSTATTAAHTPIYAGAVAGTIVVAAVLMPPPQTLPSQFSTSPVMSRGNELPAVDVAANAPISVEVIPTPAPVIANTPAASVQAGATGIDAALRPSFTLPPPDGNGRTATPSTGRAATTIDPTLLAVAAFAPPMPARRISGLGKTSPRKSEQPLPSDPLAVTCRLPRTQGRGDGIAEADEFDAPFMQDSPTNASAAATAATSDHAAAALQPPIDRTSTPPTPVQSTPDPVRAEGARPRRSSRSPRRSPGAPSLTIPNSHFASFALPPPAPRAAGLMNAQEMPFGRYAKPTTATNP